MTLPSRHMIRNSNPGGLRPSSLLLSHGGSPRYWIFTSEQGRNSFFSLKLEGQSGVRTRDLRLSKQAALTTAPGPPPFYCGGSDSNQKKNILLLFSLSLLGFLGLYKTISDNEFTTCNNHKNTRIRPTLRMYKNVMCGRGSRKTARLGKGTHQD